MATLITRFAERRSRLSILVLGALAIALAGMLGSAETGARSARYAHIDVRLELRDDGTLRVTETQRVSFIDGPFSFGFRKVPTERTEGIENVRVSELVNGQLAPFTEAPFDEIEHDYAQYGTELSGGDLEIGWSFTPAISETRTFVIEYDVLGALRVYLDADPPNQQLWRTVIGSELTEHTPVDSATVTVVLPEAVPLDQVVVATNDRDEPDDPAERSRDGQTFTWQVGAFDPGEELIVRLQFPPIVAGATAPAWQEADDERRAREEGAAEREALIHLIMAGIGVLLLAGGGVGAYGLWYARGRDPHTGVVAEFLSEPPDDLGPGVVGALLDEHSDDPDIVATLLELAHRGDIKMTDLGLVGPAKRATGHDYELELTRIEENHPAHEWRMFRALFGAEARVGDKARLSDVAPRVVAEFPGFREDLYEELVRHGYFTRAPHRTRKTWRRAGLTAVVAGGVAGVIGSLLFDLWALIPAGAAVTLGLVYWRLSRAMPSKTQAGAEASAKWRAFRKYLQDIERYEKLDESRAIFDRYLPYAVAFGIDKSWMAKFARVATPAPAWFDPGDVVILPQPWGQGGTRHGGGWAGTPGGGGPGGGLPGLDLPDLDLPDFQQGSDRAAKALGGASIGAMDVLKVAGAILEIAAAFSGGGSRGGSSGGGGGGFR